MAKWREFLDPHGNIGGIETEEGRVIAKFNPYDPPSLREALAKNLLWVQGCVLQDQNTFKVKPE